MQRNIITPALSVPIIGIVQDGLLGAYNLTQATTKVDWKSAMNMASYTSNEDFSSFNKKEGEYSGADIYSLIIPKKINVSGDFEVKNGQIVKGILKKNMLGSKAENSLIHLIWDIYGHKETRQFLDDNQRLINNFNMWNGFSVGIGDIHVPKDVEEQLSKLFDQKKLEIDHMITEMENNPDLIPADVFEDTILAELSKLGGDSSKLIMNNLKSTNNINVMILSGSKGSASNMGEMAACLGQQKIEGKRPQKRLNGRTMPYFFQGNDSAEARGFVDQPFGKGNTPTGFIFHNMGAREGIIDTGIKTAESGYVQRKLIKSLEDVVVKYDNTVRTANDAIVQYIYGDNGVNTTKQFGYTFKMLEMGNKAIADKIKFSSQELKNFKKFSAKINDEHVKEIIELRNIIRNSRMKSAINNITFDSKYHLPVNIKNVVNTVKGMDLKGDNLEPDYVLNKLDELVDYKTTKITSLSEKDRINKNSLKYQDEFLSKTVFRFALYELLSPKVCIFENGLNKAKFDMICDMIVTKFNRAIVEPGEMVGIVAAQSIGEPKCCGFQSIINANHTYCMVTLTNCRKILR